MKSSFLESNLNQVVAELLGDGGCLFRNDWVLIEADDEGLLSFDGVDSVRSLLRSDYPVCGGEVHVPGAGDGDAALGKLVGVAVLRDQGLQLLWGDRESGGRCPDVSVVAANDGVLDHLGAQKLVVDVALPTHLDLDNVAAEEELVSKTLTTKLTTLTLDKSLTDNSLEELKVASLRLQLLFPT